MLENKNVVFSKIAETIATLDTKTISKKRKLILNDLTEYIQLRIAQNKKVYLIFILPIIHEEVIYLKFGHNPLHTIF